MELKRLSFTAAFASAASFNRTSMELKPMKRSGFFVEKVAFNRTSMELKRGYGVATYKDTPSLLIEPVWN